MEETSLGWFRGSNDFLLDLVNLFLGRNDNVRGCIAAFSINVLGVEGAERRTRLIGHHIGRQCSNSGRRVYKAVNGRNILFASIVFGGSAALVIRRDVKNESVMIHQV